jgi:hypothetical protein
MLLRTKLLLFGSVLYLLLCSPLIVSVDAASMWNQNYGGTGTEVAYSIVATPDGGYAIAGYTTSFGINGFEFWLVKIDSNGIMQWNKAYGRGGPQWESSQAFSLITTPDGGYAIAGYTWSFGAGMADYWLVKTDYLGNMRWNKTYGGDNVDEAESLVATPDGGYAVLGIQWSFEPYSIWLVKTDALGNMQWNKTYEGLARDDGHPSIIATTDGGYALTGGPWMAKTDSLGYMQWNTTYYGRESGLDGDNGTYSKEFYGTYSLLATSDGGYFLAGYTINTTGEIIPLDSGNPELVDASGEVFPTADEMFFHSGLWLLKTDGLGNMLWNKTYVETGENYIYSLIATADGGYAIAGTTRALDIYGDFLLLKFDAFGNMQWNRTYGESVTANEAHSLIQAPDGGYAIAGKISSPPNWDGNFWLVKTDEFGIVPEYSSWLAPTLVLTATAFIIINKKRLLRTR